MLSKYFDKKFMKEVFYKALPFIIATIVNALIVFLDNWMIGIFQNKGSEELGAASLANKYMSIVLVFVNASIAMFSYLVFQYKGKGDLVKMQMVFKIMTQFVLIVIIISILVAQFAADDIIKLFQGDNYSKDISSSQGIAQGYMRAVVWKIIPLGIFTILIIGLNAWGKQKILIPLTAVLILMNALLNYLFYKVANLGLNGIAYSTVIVESLSLMILIWWIYYQKIQNSILFNPLKLFVLDIEILIIGLKRIAMALQVILWSIISIGISIIYSRWYGDKANSVLAIASPIVTMFYTALNGISTTKGYFVGTQIGKGDKEKALLYDKRINFYTGIAASIEGLLLISLSFVLPLVFTHASNDSKNNATLLLIFVGATYPIAAISKTLLGSFKVAGMGNIIILSNGLFALTFEFMVPLILFFIHLYGNLEMEFWQLYLLSRCIKLVKLPPTLYFWKQKKWLNKVI